MSDVQTTISDIEAGLLFEAYEQARGLEQSLRNPAAQLDPGRVAARYDRLTNFLEDTNYYFLGRDVRITPLDEDSEAITAFYRAMPILFNGAPAYKECPNGLLSRTHPRRVVGTITQLGLNGTEELRLKARWFSPHRLDLGYFAINMFDENREPLVDLEFLP
jgi:hypothetical protein